MLIRRMLLIPLAILLVLSAFVAMGPKPANAAAEADYWPSPGNAKIYRYDDGLFRIALAGPSKDWQKPYEWKIVVNGKTFKRAEPRPYRIRLIEHSVAKQSVIEVFRNGEMRYSWRVTP